MSNVMLSPAGRAVKRYPISCAGCGARRVFRTVESLAAWVSRHCCWGAV